MTDHFYERAKGTMTSYHYRKLKGAVEYFGNESLADIPEEWKEDFLEFILIKWRNAADGNVTVLNEIQAVARYTSCSFSSTGDCGFQIQYGDATVGSVDSQKAPPFRDSMEFQPEQFHLSDVDTADESVYSAPLKSPRIHSPQEGHATRLSFAANSREQEPSGTGGMFHQILEYIAIQHFHIQKQPFREYSAPSSWHFSSATGTKKWLRSISDVLWGVATERIVHSRLRE